MNANFGIILKKREREIFTEPLPRHTRSWGEETVFVGDPQYGSPIIKEVLFQIYPLTKFILDHLDGEFRKEDLEYAWMAGIGLDSYELYVNSDDFNSGVLSEFERGFKGFVDQLSKCYVLFAPESDRLSNFISVTSDDIISVLRSNLRNMHCSNGFLAEIIIS